MAKKTVSPEISVNAAEDGIPSIPSAVPASPAEEVNPFSERLKRYFAALTSGVEDELKASCKEQCLALVSDYPSLSNYLVVGLLEANNRIDEHDLNRIFSALRHKNGQKLKDILLIVLSNGGGIEPAYQISKLCKSFSAHKFSVAIPRYAKSAATLLALGADEIHMGPLGQLGPVDPQLSGLPALGVSQALKTIASLSEQFPGSANMFALYLKEILTVEQIGYCERIAESAMQYAQRLLATKNWPQERSDAIARKLVHEYKHHGFVIDLEEAQALLGEGWVMTDTDEIRLAEDLYSFFDQTNFFLRAKSRELLLLGDLEDGFMILNRG